MIAIPGRTVALFSLFALATSLQPATAQSDKGGSPEIIKHRTKDPHDTSAPTAGSTGSQTPLITYHGGPLLDTPVVYIIWYGNWNQANGSDTPAGQQLVRDFIHGLSGSAYFAINKSYTTPTGYVTTGAEYTDTGSQGSRLSDSKVQAVVSSAISGGHLILDTKGVYFVLTSSNVTETSGFCTQYCGWHTSGTISGANIKYSFVGNANRCLNACAAQSVSPNYNAGVDGMISVIAHELEETTTDPNPRSGWADSGGAENGDKCAWTFGSQQSLQGNGSYSNVSLPGVNGVNRTYLIQRNLDANSVCYIDYVTKAQ